MPTFLFENKQFENHQLHPPLTHINYTLTACDRGFFRCELQHAVSLPLCHTRARGLVPHSGIQVSEK